MPKRLYVAWQDQRSRSWHTIGRLTKLENDYEFVFTKGAAILGTLPNDLLRMNVHHAFRSRELLPLFRNKLPTRSRPDYFKMADWLGLEKAADEFELLSKFGLIPGTDSILVYPEPEIANGRYQLDFFVHAIRHMTEEAQGWCFTCEVGARLLPLLDVQNPVDKDAVALRPEADNFLLGYIPTFYAGDFRKILGEPRLAPAAKIRILQCNEDAPPQLKLLCRFEAPVPLSFRAFDDEVHEPLEQPLQIAL